MFYTLYRTYGSTIKAIRVSYSFIPLILAQALMVEGHSCLGCGKLFPTHKRLHAHEARCQDYKQLQADLERSQKCLRTIRDKDEGLRHLEPHVADTNPIEILPRAQMLPEETFYFENNDRVGRFLPMLHPS